MSQLTAIVLAMLFVRGVAFAQDDHDHDEHAHEEHTDEVKLTPEAIERYGIKLGTATKEMLRPALSVPARVALNPDATAHVGTIVRGRVIQIHARLGDTVKVGDALLLVESSELGEAQSDFLQKRTVVTVAEAAVAPARESASRARSLFDQSQGIALGEVQKREAELKAAEGALLNAQAAAQAAENKLHLMGMDQAAVILLISSGEIDARHTIRAPVAGQVIEREVTLGELVNPDDEALLVLADTNTLWVLAEVPEAQVKSVAVGAEARVVALGEAIDGKVTLIWPTLDPATRTARVRIEVSDGKSLKAGMFATAQITTSSADGSEVVVVPESAIQTVEGGPAVFVPVEKEPNTFAKRAVTIGKPVSGFVPIMAGLNAGDQIVVRGAFLLKAELGKSEAGHEH
jgi:cobalt-zinc-cadmium efflux system membrane fusion protein